MKHGDPSPRGIGQAWGIPIGLLAIAGVFGVSPVLGLAVLAIVGLLVLA